MTETTSATAEGLSPLAIKAADDQLTAYLQARATDHEAHGWRDDGVIEARGGHTLNAPHIDVTLRRAREAEAARDERATEVAVLRSALARTKAVAEEWHQYAVKHPEWPRNFGLAAMGHALSVVLTALDGGVPYAPIADAPDGTGVPQPQPSITCSCGHPGCHDSANGGGDDCSDCTFYTSGLVGDEADTPAIPPLDTDPDLEPYDLTAPARILVDLPEPPKDAFDAMLPIISGSALYERYRGGEARLADSLLSPAARAWLRAPSPHIFEALVDHELIEPAAKGALPPVRELTDEECRREFGLRWRDAALICFPVALVILLIVFF